MENDLQREKDIQSLCEAVLNASPAFYDNPNGGYENTCPFCGNIGYGGHNNLFISMHEIRHSDNCAYHVAKDLSAGCV